MPDHHRPVYHLMPPENWMNDPNGLIQYQGVYHVFYQHNPYGALWGSMSWGHARSHDLVHWEHLPIAIRPDATGPDADGCYSGAVVMHNGQPTMVYTGARSSDQLCCLAFPDDEDLVTWRKFEGNPVISAEPTDLPLTIFRDHTLWREDDIWYMGIGSGIEHRGGAVLLYRSADLQHWEYLHPLAVEQPELNPHHEIISIGWECPDFFFLENEPVLLACEWDGDAISSAWWRGSMMNHRFKATSKGFADAGDALYAPQTFRAEDGRRLCFGWIRELRSDSDQLDAGWSGVMSLPREALLRNDGTIGFRPAAEVYQLRETSRVYSHSDGTILTSASCHIEFACQSIPDGLSLRWGDDLAITWDGESLNIQAGDRAMQGTIPGDPLELFVLEIFIDHSVVEVFLGNRIVMSTRIYGSANLWSKAAIDMHGDDYDIFVWDIASIW